LGPFAALEGASPSIAAHLELIAVGLAQAEPLLHPCLHHTTLASVVAILITALGLITLAVELLHLAAIIVIVKLRGSAKPQPPHLITPQGPLPRLLPVGQPMPKRQVVGVLPVWWLSFGVGQVRVFLERRLVMGQQVAARVVVVLPRWLAWLLHSYLNIAFVFC